MNVEHEAWVESIHRMNDEAAGAVYLQVIQLQDVPELLAYALLGDPEATRLANLTSDTLRRIKKAPPGRPMLCAACPRALRGGRYSLVAVIPHRDDATQAMTLAVCTHCGFDHRSILQAAQQGLRRVWPDCRAIDIHPTEGRA